MRNGFLTLVSTGTFLLTATIARAGWISVDEKDLVEDGDHYGDDVVVSNPYSFPVCVQISIDDRDNISHTVYTGRAQINAGQQNDYWGSVYRENDDFDWSYTVNYEESKGPC